ncbi:MAG: hypothetical protein IJN04_04325 [Clostridia bacterium]|nr:hypothetical protein [Clostridia bacterium]
MAKQSLGEMIQDYVDVKLGCGGVVLGVGVAIVVVMGIMSSIRDAVNNFSDEWPCWFAIIGMAVLMLLTGYIGSKTKSYSKKLAGCISILGGAIHIAVAIWLMTHTDLTYDFASLLSGGFLLFVGIGVFSLGTEKE